MDDSENKTLEIAKKEPEEKEKAVVKPVKKKLSDFKLFVFDKYAEKLVGRIQGDVMTGIEEGSLYENEAEYVRRKIEDTPVITNEKFDDTKNDVTVSDDLDEFVNEFVESVLKKCVEESNVNETVTQPDLVDGEEEDLTKDSNRNLSVSKLNNNKYDRPLSGYAEKLADFLDDDDFDEMTETEDDEEETDDDEDEEEEDSEEDESDEVDDEEEMINSDTSSQKEIIIHNTHSEMLSQQSRTDDQTIVDDQEKQTDSTLNLVDKHHVKDEDSNKINGEIIENGSNHDDGHPLESDTVKNTNSETSNNVNNEIKDDTKTETSTKKSFPAPSVVRKRQNKNRRARGERPKSLYEQDLLNSILKEEIVTPVSDEEDENTAEAKPISERAILLEKKIPLLQRSNSLPSESCLDDSYTSQSLSRQTSQSKRKLLFYCHENFDQRVYSLVKKF